ncbi:MAG TPA: SDR family oxidoreductase [Dehalococcoidia bacterium]|nr:SDR family oxidoreductase [Dehalococcoidia bacterium]
MTADPVRLMEGRVCLVTGASSGIGRETALALARMGATVVMHGRDPGRSAAAADAVREASPRGDVDLVVADLSSQAGVRHLAAEVLARHDSLHVLVNNAGVIRTRREITVDGLEQTFALNHLAYFLLTELLLDRLRASAPARIVNVSSAAHARARLDFNDLQNERRYGMGVYGQSKLANVLFTYELARRLEGSEVTANCLHPGVVGTRFGLANTGPMGRALWLANRLTRLLALSSAKGARTSIHLATSPEVDGVSGRYFAKSKAIASSEASYDEESARRLWEASEQLVASTA